jgi:hypothetical protein
MSVKDALEVALTVIASLGGGGAIVFGLSGYLGKLWAERGLEKQRQEYSRLNTEFNHQLDLASRRVQMELDTLGYLHKLRTESEFQKIREMWKSISYLRISINGIPKSGLSFVSADPETEHKNSVENSYNFVKRCNETFELWSAESLSIPKNISDAVEELLKVARVEQVYAAQYPDPFYKTTMVMFEPAGRKQFFDDRDQRLKEFNTKSENLQAMMREYLQGGGVKNGNC